MDHLGTHRNRRDGAPLTRIALVALLALIVGAGVWTFATRDWNASGTQKSGSPYSSAPAEGGKPLVLNK